MGIKKVGAWVGEWKMRKTRALCNKDKKQSTWTRGHVEWICVSVTDVGQDT